MKRRIYLSGGMSGVERAEYVRRFGEAERILRRHGYGPLSNVSANFHFLLILL